MSKHNYRRRSGWSGQFAAAALALLFSFAAAGNATAQVNVVATVKPLQLIASAITDGVTRPELLIPENQSYHHFNLRPSSMRALTAADLVLWVGPELEVYLGDVIYQLPSRTGVIAAAGLPDLVRLGFDSTVLIEDHHHENEHRGHHDVDPHIWLDTNNARVIARELAARLADIDASNAEVFQQNLAQFLDALDRFDEQNRAVLASLADRPYAVYHNAFQYFEQQFGLQHELVIVADGEMQPGMRHMLGVRNALQAMDLACLMEDVTANPATINAVLGRLPLRRVSADTLGHGLPEGPDGYLQLMSGLSEAFQRCLTRD